MQTSRRGVTHSLVLSKNHTCWQRTHRVDVQPKEQLHSCLSDQGPARKATASSQSAHRPSCSGYKLKLAFDHDRAAFCVRFRRDARDDHVLYGFTPSTATSGSTERLVAETAQIRLARQESPDPLQGSSHATGTGSSYILNTNVSPDMCFGWKSI